MKFSNWFKKAKSATAMAVTLMFLFTQVIGVMPVFAATGDATGTIGSPASDGAQITSGDLVFIGTAEDADNGLTGGYIVLKKGAGDWVTFDGSTSFNYSPNEQNAFHFAISPLNQNDFSAWTMPELQHVTSEAGFQDGDYTAYLYLNDGADKLAATRTFTFTTVQSTTEPTVTLDCTVGDASLDYPEITFTVISSDITGGSLQFKNNDLSKWMVFDTSSGGIYGTNGVTYDTARSAGLGLEQQDSDTWAGILVTENLNGSNLFEFGNYTAYLLVTTAGNNYPDYKQVDFSVPYIDQSGSVTAPANMQVVSGDTLSLTGTYGGTDVLNGILKFEYFADDDISDGYIYNNGSYQYGETEANASQFNITLGDLGQWNTSLSQVQMSGWPDGNYQVHLYLRGQYRDITYTEAAVQSFQYSRSGSGSNTTAGIALPTDNFKINAAFTEQSLTVQGSALGTGFDHYVLNYYVQNPDDQSWGSANQITSGSSIVESSNLGVWDVSSLSDGRYKLELKVMDSSSGILAADEVQIVIDKTPPQITLAGDNPISIEVGDTYSEPGASASDNLDGDISGIITIDSSSVDTSTAGTYTVLYSVSDGAGNTASAERQVIVADAQVGSIIISPTFLNEGYQEQNLTLAEDGNDLWAANEALAVSIKAVDELGNLSDTNVPITVGTVTDTDITITLSVGLTEGNYAVLVLQNSQVIGQGNLAVNSQQQNPGLDVTITDQDTDRVYYNGDTLSFNIRGVGLPPGAQALGVKFNKDQSATTNIVGGQVTLAGTPGQTGFDFTAGITGNEAVWPLMIKVGYFDIQGTFYEFPDQQPMPLLDQTDVQNPKPVLLNIYPPSFLDGSTTDFSGINDLRSVSGLTFEISGKGKIVFNSSVDVLANQSEFASLGETGKLVIETGRIGLNSSDISFLASKGATLTMYGLSYPHITIDNILAYDDNGNPIADVASLISNLNYNAVSGELSFDVTGFSTYEVSVPSGDASLASFTVGGQSVLDLSGLEVTDPQNEAGAVLEAADFSGFQGISVIPADNNAASVVMINGVEVAQADLATQAVAAGDVVIVVITAEDGTVKSYKVTLQQTVLFTPFKISENTTTNQNVDMAKDENGGIHLVYERGGSVYYTKLANSAIYGEELIGTGTSPVIAVSVDGIPHVAYVESGNIKYTNRAGGTWQEPELVSTGTQVDIDVDGNGAVHLVYTTSVDSDSYKEIIYSNNSSGSFASSMIYDGDWYYSSGYGTGRYYDSPVIQVDSGGSYYLAVDHDGRDSTPGFVDNWSLIIFKTNYGAGINTGSASEYSSGKFTLRNNSLSLDSSEIPRLLFEKNGKIFYVNNPSSQTWSEIELAIGNSGSLASGSNGSLGIAFIDGSNNLMYMENTGTGFGTAVQIDTGVSGLTAVALTDNKYVAYIKSGEVYVASTDSLSRGPGINISGVSEGGKYNTSVTPVITVTGGNYTSTLNGQEFISGIELQDDGLYTLIVNAVNPANNLQSSEEVNFAIDKTAAQATSIIINSNNTNSRYAKAGDTVTLSIVTDEPVNQPTVSILGKNVDASGSGSNWSVQYTLLELDTEGIIEFSIGCTDLFGNKSTFTAATDGGNVTFDNTPPSINLEGNSSVQIEIGSGEYTDAGVTVTDNSGADLSDAVEVAGSVNTAVVGQYTLTFNVSDGAGNTAQAITRTVNVVDTTAPVITLLGDNPTVVEVGSGQYTDSGVTVTDNSGADLSSNVIVSGTVNTGKVGDYTLTYNVSDGAGNAAQAVTRTVNVVDTTAPVITLLGDNPTVVEVGSGQYTDSGVTVTDNSGTDLRNSLVVSGSVNTAATGSYTLTYNVSDGAGNAAQAVTRTVNVVDTTSPVITLLGDNPVVIEAGSGAYSDAGATVTDNSGADLSIAVVVTGSVNTAVVGNYTLTFNVSDGAGNAAQAVTRTVSVVDTIAPVITLNGENMIIVELGTSFTDPGAAAEDNYDGNITDAVQVSGLVDINQTGEYTLTYQVSDSSNNSAQVSRTVNIVDTTAPVISVGVLPEFVDSFSYTISGLYEEINLDKIEVSLDGGTQYSVVDSAANGSFSKQLTLAEGENDLVVRAVDNAGNTALLENLRIKVDNVNPVVSINDSSISGQSAQFLASITEANLDANRITATLDDGYVQHTYESSSNGITINLSGLVDGSHTLTIAVYDLAGRTGSDSITFDVDTTEPEVIAQITSPANGLPDGENGYYRTSPQVTLVCHEQLDIYYNFDGTVGSNGTLYSGSISVEDVPASSTKVLNYWATDAAGNQGSGQLTFTKIDTEPPGSPDLSLDAPTSSSTVSVVLTGTAEAGSVISAKVEGKDEVTAATDGNGNFTITVNLSVEGSNEITLTAEDSAGHISRETAHTITRDTRGPDLEITFDNQSSTLIVTSSEDLSDYPTITITDESTDPLTHTLQSDVNFRVYTYSVSRLLAGNINITATGTDANGNEGFGTLTLQEVAANQNNNINLGNGNQLQIPNGAMNNNGQFSANTPPAGQFNIPPGIRFLTSAFQFLINGGGYNFNQNILANLSVNGGNAGNIFVMTQVNGNWVFFDLGTLLGNIFSFSTGHFSDFGIGEDNQAPEITFSQTYPKLTNNAGFAVSGNITDNISLYGASLTVGGNTVPISGVDGQADTTGSFTCQPNLAEGENNLTVVVTDRFNNSRQYSIKITLDTAAQLNVTQPGQNQLRTKANSLTVKGTSETGANITVNFNGGQVSQVTAPSNQEITMGVIDLSSKNDGSYALNIIAQDPAGNSNTKALTITKDTKAGLRNISAPTLVTTSSAQITGETDTGDTVTSKLNGSTTGVNVSRDGTGFTVQLIGLQEGNNTVQIISTDDLSNSKSETKVIKYDTAALYTVGSKTPGDSNLVSGKYYTQGNLSYLLQVNRAAVLSLKNGENLLDTETAAAPKQVTLTGTIANDGEYTITIAGAEAGAGQQLTESYTIVRDTVNPVVSLSRSVPTSTSTSNVTISGTVFDANPLKNYQIFLNGGSTAVKNGNIVGNNFSDTVTLASGSNDILVKVWDYTGNVGEAAVTITYTPTTPANPPSNDGGGGGGGGGSVPPAQQTKVSSPLDQTSLKTEDDKSLDKALIETGQAKLSLAGKAEPKVSITPNILTALAKENKPLTIEDKGIKLEFPAQSLVTQELSAAVQGGEAKVELGAKEVSVQEKQEIFQKAGLGESTGLFEVGGIVVDLTAQVSKTTESGVTTTDKIDSFGEPVAVTIDLSDANISPEEIAQLTAVRYEKDDAGNITPIKLGGTYNPLTKTFTFYTDKFSLYGVAKAKELVAIKLSIGNQLTQVNGINKFTDVAPTIINNRTMVPIRFVSENLGANVEWHEDTRTVNITLGDKRLGMVIGEVGPGLDTPPLIINSRTLVPLRYVSENIGASVIWFPSKRGVEIVK